MKVAPVEELLDSIGELPGAGPITKLIKLIIKAASTARKQNRICRKFARWLEMIEGLLKPLLEVPNLMERPETRKPLKQLEESLGQAYQLVIKYKDRSYPYRFVMGSDIAERFDDMRNDIKDCIGLIPLIKLFIDQTIIRRVNTRSQPDKEEEMDQNNEEKMDLKKGNNKEEGKDKEEEEKVKEKGRDKRNDMEKGKEENEMEKGRDREDPGKVNKQNEEYKGSDKAGKDTENEKKKKKNVRPLVNTAVLKVAMRCECDGCPGRINHSIRKYPGVERTVMEVDKGAATVTVLGHFDAKMLRDYVAKKTKKEVQLVDNDNGGREREDHQVVLLEKTGHNKSIGDKPLKGGSSNNKRVVPMMVAATVVIKVGDMGLRCECNGCVDKIRDALFKITGVQKVGVDTDKNQVTVTGTNMDIDNLVEKLGKKVDRPVEVVQPGMTDGRG